MIVHAYYPLGETRVQREAEALLRHGFQVDVICLRKNGEKAQDEFNGAQVYRLPVRRSKGGSLAKQMLEYLLFCFMAMLTVSRRHFQSRYNTVQVHNLPDFLIFAAWLPKLFGSRVILDLHDLMPEFYAGRFGPGSNAWLLRLIRWQERLACRFADHVITVSEHWRQALIQRGVRADKCSVVMNVADDRIFRPPADGDPQPDRHRGLQLIYHGTVTHRYGLDLALRAVARLQDRCPDVHLTILGSGDAIPGLRKLQRELELDEHVTILNQLKPAEELPAFIRAVANIGIVPYRNDVFTDGLLPTKLMEYAALGLPAIAARTTAIESYFDESMVSYFEPDNIDDLTHCLCRLYNQPERLAELAKGSETFNQRYNWTQISGAYVKLVQRLGTR